MCRHGTLTFWVCSLYDHKAQDYVRQSHPIREPAASHCIRGVPSCSGRLPSAVSMAYGPSLLYPLGAMHVSPAMTPSIAFASACTHALAGNCPAPLTGTTTLPSGLRLDQTYDITDANDARAFSTPIHPQEVLPRLHNSLEHRRILLCRVRVQVHNHTSQVLAISADMDGILLLATDQELAYSLIDQ